ncbi:MAG: DUF255 domain-containing protein [Campylobacterales bacterium]
MKKFISSIAIVSSLFGSELNWLHNYNKALELAKKQNKGIYVFVGADRCRFCNILKDKALSKKSVMKRLTKDFIPVYMSRDRHNIPKIFSTKGVPRHYFLTKEGKLIHEDQGSREESGFLLLLDEVDLDKEN